MFCDFFFRFSVTYLGCLMCLGATSTNPSKISLIYILSEAGKLKYELELARTETKNTAKSLAEAKSLVEQLQASKTSALSV